MAANSVIYPEQVALKPLTALLAAVVMAMATLGCGGDSGETRAITGLSTSPTAEAQEFDRKRAWRDLKAQVEFGPRPAGSQANRRMVRWIARRLRQAGVEGVRIQKPQRNLVGHIPGQSDRTIVVGAHHDTKDVPGLVGANDGASGVAVVLELARAMPKPVPGPSIHFVLFDAEEARGKRPFEEDGIRGSRQYVRYAQRSKDRQGTPTLSSMRAMVLFDLVGDCDLQIPLEPNSDPRLYARFARFGKPFEGTTNPIADDHVPFRQAGIPAVDLIDFTYGPGESPGRHWHTTEDTLDKVCPKSLEAVGAPALEVLLELR